MTASSIKSIVLAGGFALMAGHAVAQDGLRTALDIGVGYDRFMLSHDASSLGGGLGSPTSVLDYSTLVAPEINLSATTGADAPFYFRLDGSFANTSLGVLTDTDYKTGQVISGDTVGDVSGSQFGLAGRISPPVTAGFAAGSGILRPYLAGDIAYTSVKVMGALCYTVCARPDVATSIQSSSQQRYSASIGPGVVWEADLGGGQSFSAHAQAGVGYARVDESHLLRTDLGPMPNIRYGFWTAETAAGVEYQHPLSDRLTLSAGVDLNAQYGRGTAVFSASTPTPLSPLPANLVAYGATAHVSLGGKF